MAWERGAWEKTTSHGANYNNRNNSDVRHVTDIRMTDATDYRKKNYNGRKSSNNGSSHNNKYSNYKKQIKKTKNNKKTNQDTIKKQMDDIIRLMKLGNSRDEACKKLNINPKVAKEWYDKGWFGDNEFYKNFYNRVKSIKYSTDKPKSKNKSGIKSKQKQNNVERRKNVKPKYSSPNKLSHNIPVSIKNQMNQIISRMRDGEDRNQAAVNVGVPISRVNEWYNKGLNNVNYDYRLFYRKIKNIEEDRNRTNKNAAPKSKVKESMIICSKCGKKYKHSLVECPHCKNSTKKSSDEVEVNYCINCGKKIRNSNSDYCMECEKSVNVNNSNNFAFVVLILFLIIIFIVLLNIM